MGTLENTLKFIGAVPVESRPKQSPTALQLELDKIRYRIGAIAYKPGQEYLKEPIQWNIIKQGIYDKLKF